MREAPTCRSQKRMHVLTQVACYCCPVVSRISLFRQIVVTLPSTEFQENPFSGTRVVT
jgi:hypothetical protein